MPSLLKEIFLAMVIVYILIGVVIGIVFCYLFLKIHQTKKYVLKTEFEDSQNKLQSLSIEAATKLSADKIEQFYVSKDLYHTIKDQLKDFQEKNEELETSNNYLQENIVKLTEESSQKISKQEITERYVDKQSFDIIQNKLTNTENQLTKKEEEVLRLSNELTAFTQQEKNLQEKLGLFNAELETLHKNTSEQFKNIATEILEEKKKYFVDENKKELNTILDPLKNNLQEFKTKIEATRKEDIQDITSLKKEIENLHKLNNQLSDDAKNLATALKSEVKMQGNWGEDRLNMILEVEGLQKYIDYSREEMYHDEEQEKNRKPDFILKLPNNKNIIIDSKVSLTAYVNYFNAPSADEKMKHLHLHLKSVKDHIETLADKNYQSLAGLQTPDYVFLFMPIESALTLALNQSPEIFNHALKRKIVLITPTTLVATLKVVKIIWQKENQVKNVEEIFRQCGELYNKFVAFIEDMEKVETALLQASKVQREAMNKLKDGTKKGNTIIGRFETIKKLEAKTNKEIPEKYLREIDLLPDEE